MKKVICALMVIVVAWACISFADVLVNNMGTHPVYCSWNFFNILF